MYHVWVCPAAIGYQGGLLRLCQRQIWRMWERLGDERVCCPLHHPTLADFCRRIYHPVHPVYKAIGGYLREEAIMILRRFYITENTNGVWWCVLHFTPFADFHLAPVPKSKANRILKTEILPE